MDVPVEKVWNALTQEAELKKWYFPVENYIFEVGKEFTFYESEDSRMFLHRCQFLTIIPHKIIEYSWSHPSHSKGSSVVRWKLETVAGKTFVMLTHKGVENFKDAGVDFAKENYEMGWNAIVKTTLRNYLYGIERLVFEIEVNATPSVLWHKLWHNGNYTRWTEPFCKGSYIKGKLFSGERVHFLAPSGEGMYSDITFFKENELLVFSHIGIIQDMKELPINSETEKWTGSFETYRLKQNGDITCLKVEVDTTEEYTEYMKNTFPLALQRLKEITENE
jgi:uncharacterized protein YndB with AHSA1/START domain